MTDRPAQFLAVLLALVLLSRLELVRMLVLGNSMSARLMILLLMLPLVLAIAGLARGRMWGFYAAYPLVPIATILHGVALVPFVTRWLPVPQRPTAVLILNLLVLALLVFAHQRRRGRKVTQAEES